jgi:DNA-binding MarR family transcriptional regulator
VEDGNVGGEADALPDSLLDDALVVSRVFVAIAGRSLSDATNEVTVAQFRALIVLASAGPQSVANFGRHLDLQPPAMSRMIDRLARRTLVERVPSARSRREVEVRLTERGATLVRDVLYRRREDIGKLLSGIPRAQWPELHTALKALAEASGEPLRLKWADDFPFSSDGDGDGSGVSRG